MTINHVFLMVPKAKMAAMQGWYSQALAPINYHVQIAAHQYLVGMGPKGGFPHFWIKGLDADHVTPTHICFDAKS